MFMTAQQYLEELQEGRQPFSEIKSNQSEIEKQEDDMFELLGNAIECSNKDIKPYDKIIGVFNPKRNDNYM